MRLDVYAIRPVEAAHRRAEFAAFDVVANVQGDGSSIGVFAWYGPGTMADNAVSWCNDALSANHSKGIQFLRNTVSHSGSGVMVWPCTTRQP